MGLYSSCHRLILHSLRAIAPQLCQQVGPVTLTLESHHQNLQGQRLVNHQPLHCHHCYNKTMTVATTTAITTSTTSTATITDTLTLHTNPEVH